MEITIEELKKSFREQESRLKLLHEIDRKILDEAISLEEICREVLFEIVKYSKSDVGYIFIDAGTEFLLLQSTRDIEGFDVIPFTNDMFRENIIDEPYTFQNLNQIRASAFPMVSQDCYERILIPLTESKRLWGVLGIECKKTPKPSSLNAIEVQEFLKTVCGQVSVAISERKQKNELKQLYKLQEDLFEKELDITESLKSIISNIICSMPELGPLKIDSEPEVQIMFYEEGGEFLSIRATTGPESVNTRVSVKNSISGVLVQDQTLTFYLCDPTTFPEKYKSYLGKSEEGAPPKEIRTELVVPIRFDHKLIGLINLESEKIDAFKLPLSWFR
jgi:transcriptional regulator with GAF, ATPase, and Fis domain